MKRSRQKAVSMYKGIAILLVVLCHCAQRFELPFWAQIIPRYGQMGCQVFFVLSAYTLSISMLENKQTYQEYMERRLRRLIPGYWLAILTYGIIGTGLTLILGRNPLNTNITVQGYAVNALLLHGLIPTSVNNRVVRGGWFAGTIFLFYIVFPVLHRMYYKMAKYRRIGFPMVFQILSFMATMIIESVSSLKLTNNSFLYFHLYNQLPCLTVGLVMADLFKTNELYGKKRYMLLGGGAFLASIALFFSKYRYAFIFLPTLIGIAFLFLYACSHQRIERRQSRILNGVCSIGNMSYTIYLFHMFAAYEGSSILKKCLSFLGFTDGLGMYAVCLPFLIAGAVLIGYICHRCNSAFQAAFMN